MNLGNTPEAFRPREDKYAPLTVQEPRRDADWSPFMICKPIPSMGGTDTDLTVIDLAENIAGLLGLPDGILSFDKVRFSIS